MGDIRNFNKWWHTATPYLRLERRFETCTYCGIVITSTADYYFQAHTVISTPSILATFVRDEYPNIKVVAVAGEPCPTTYVIFQTQIPDSPLTSCSLADEWSQQVEFYNCCGPTEVTIVNTMHRHKAGTELTIGKPVPNTSVYILDDNEQPVPIGATGFMWVGGAAVSRGYLNLPELTATRYKYDIFRDDGL